MSTHTNGDTVINTFVFIRVTFCSHVILLQTYYSNEEMQNFIWPLEFAL